MRYVIALLVGIGFFAPKFAMAQVRIGDVAIEKDVDPITDEDRSLVIAIAKERNLGALGWRCLEDGFKMVVMSPSRLGGDINGKVNVIMRFDAHPAEEMEKWPLHVSRQLVMAPDSSIYSLTAKATKARQVTVRVRDPATGASKTDVYSLMGLTRALGMLPCYKP